MLPIQRNFWADKKSAVAADLDIPVVCSKLDLYQAIARHIGLNPDELPLDILLNAIDGRNQELACDGVTKLKTPPVLPIVTVTKPIKRSKGSLAVAIARPRVTPKPVLKRR